MALPAARAQRRGWLTLGAGVGGLMLLTAVGWSALAPEAPEGGTATVEALPAEPQEPPSDAGPETAAPPAPPDTAVAPTPPAATEPAAVATAQDSPADTPDSYVTIVRLEKGDTVGSVLRELDFEPREIGNAVKILASHLKLSRLRVGQAMTLTVRTPDEADAKPIMEALSIRPEARREITLQRDDSGAYSAAEKIFEVIRKLVSASGVVNDSFVASAVAAGVPRPALAEMVRAFAWDVNFQHDIKAGDRFAVLIEQSWTTDGKLADRGRVLWAELTTDAQEQTYSIYRFKPRKGASSFFYGDGRSVVKALLRTPLSLGRISSRFGMRRHPVLGYSRMHRGIDFAAPPGTPVLAAGAGKVMQAGRNRGYGNWVKIGHSRGLATGYAHLSRIARGIRPGHRVRQGQVIGFVGSTGLSTGPHLHFELHRNGTPVNPLNVARTSLRASLAGQELARFKATVARIDGERQSAEVLRPAGQ